MTKKTSALEELLQVIRTLRGENGCPWDREQTLESLKPYLIEESYEMLDAVDSGDPGRHLDELGDVFLQVVLHSQIREEEGAFTFQDVVEHLTRKIVRRHPHVFGDVKVTDSKEVLRHWEAIKAQEKRDQEGRASVLEGVPNHLPALQKAQRIQSRAARVGFDWPRVEEVVGKIREELEEVEAAIAESDPGAVQEELGDLLFSVVNLSRYQDVHAEEALRATNNKFIRRFREVERRIDEAGRTLGDCTLEEMDAHWEAVKRDEPTL